MDIVTHAAMGLVGASPILATHPSLAMAFVFGSVAPDMDAFTRLFGKRAFMRWHQTYSHSLVIAVLVVVLFGILSLVPMISPLCAVALGVGMVFHSLLDVTNTYGIKLFAPWSNRRFCLEWLFFIDTTVLLAVGVLGAWMMAAIVAGNVEALYLVGGTFWAFTAVYWGMKAVLRWHAGRLAPAGTSTLMPSAWIPWVFLGCQSAEGSVNIFRIHALTGRLSDEETIPFLDDGFSETLRGSPEFNIMRFSVSRRRQA